ncbi:MAG: hypothetical protein Tsb009_00370 [Planctomycetaceae bacterium]
MIAQFALRLMCGMSLTWCIMPRSKVTSGFFRIQMLVTLGLSVLAALSIGHLTEDSETAVPLLSQSVSRTLCALAAGISFFGSVMWTLERRIAGAVCCAGVLACSSCVLLFGFLPGDLLTTSSGILAMLSDLSTSTMLGGCMTTMLLGHWYLTSPTMSLDPLKTLTFYFGIAVGIRFGLSATGLGFGWSEITDSTQVLWLTLRWLAGVFGPLAVAFMSWRILRYRNTQSATGVLFVGVILTFIGELSAALLFAELGIAL